MASLGGYRASSARGIFAPFTLIARMAIVATELSKLSLADASELVRRKSVSPIELTAACLKRIEQLNPTFNAFITVTAETAMQEARTAEAEIQRDGWKGPLHGIPIALKDLFDTTGIRTTAGSAVFQDRIPHQDAEVVRRLKAAGAVLLGKLNLHEFAYGGSGIIGHFPAARNPRDASFITGGSSSGSAAAVGAELCYAALGTDTAGSIRLPAALCGIVGLKPTYGRVSTRGVIPLSWSYDHVGPMTRTVQDTALLLQVIAGHDPSDISSVNVPVPDYVAALKKDTRGLRVGAPRQLFYDDVDPEIADSIQTALQLISELTAGVREMTLPVDTDRSASSAEAWTFHEKLVAEHADLYQPETLRRIRTGEKLTAAAYIQKRRELEQLRQEIAVTVAEVDLLVTPTTPVLAPSFAELEADPTALRARELLLLRNTRPFNVFGLPTISLPCGVARDGRCVGLQISGKGWDEGSVLALAHAYESAHRTAGT
ncbi:MAG TPA: amidase [Terriglobales bacterium]|nr:amidase [Terriglobales bacterium]